ncbi:hypothetical protein EVAR_59512_1 [Eumeta japonica]|uniref:Uncharacterized protein n=1 Tax=Eumeta variegata TaxID=151549 RepID=A0A4C1XXC5_EUMVA|nr:hypothetical protein EVAR_59512_1 [Eumeta japonica]
MGDFCPVSRKDRRKNSDAREGFGLKEDVVTRVERGMLRWFGHRERMNERRLTKQIYRANVSDGKVPARRVVMRARGPRRPPARVKCKYNLELYIFSHPDTTYHVASKFLRIMGPISERFFVVQRLARRRRHACW